MSASTDTTTGKSSEGRWPGARAIAEALKGRKLGEGRYLCHCPAHADAVPSLSVIDGHCGRPVFFCHAGCDWRAVRDALAAKGLAPRFIPKRKGRRWR